VNLVEHFALITNYFFGVGEDKKKTFERFFPRVLNFRIKINPPQDKRNPIHPSQSAVLLCPCFCLRNLMLRKISKRKNLMSQTLTAEVVHSMEQGGDLSL
jgi:hypothetical protein